LKELDKDPPRVREALAALKNLIDWFYAIDRTVKAPKPPVKRDTEPPRYIDPVPTTDFTHRRRTFTPNEDRPNVIPMPPAGPFPLPGTPNIVPNP
jgi:hypothetical protein